MKTVALWTSGIVVGFGMVALLLSDLSADKIPAGVGVWQRSRELKTPTAFFPERRREFFVAEVDQTTQILDTPRKVGQLLEFSSHVSGNIVRHYKDGIPQPPTPDREFEPAIPVVFVAQRSVNQPKPEPQPQPQDPELMSRFQIMLGGRWVSLDCFSKGATIRAQGETGYALKFDWQSKDGKTVAVKVPNRRGDFVVATGDIELRVPTVQIMSGGKQILNVTQRPVEGQ